MRLDENKTELFQFLANEAVSIDPECGQVVSTCGQEVICNVPEYDHSIVSPCNHEEADTRLILHARDCVNNNLNKILIRTVDTDVVILAIAFFHRLSAQELWIAFGTGKKYRYISVNEIATILGLE